MDFDPLKFLWSLLPILCTIAVLAALIVLWRTRHSIWLVVAMASSVLEILLRIQQTIAPGLYQVLPYLFLLWHLAAVMFAAGLVGYALESARKR